MSDNQPDDESEFGPVNLNDKKPDDLSFMIQPTPPTELKKYLSETIEHLNHWRDGNGESCLDPVPLCETIRRLLKIVGVLSVGLKDISGNACECCNSRCEVENHAEQLLAESAAIAREKE